MEINSSRANFCTSTDLVLFCGTAIDVRSFFHTTFPSTSVVFLTIHDTLLTADKRRVFCVSVSCVFLVSNAVDTICDFCAVLRMSAR